MSFHDFYRMSSHAVIVNAQRQVLQLQANYADKAWGLPGGGLDCAVRADYLSGVYFHASVSSHAFIFRCHLADDAQIQLSAEHSAWRWFDLDELSPVQRIRVDDCLHFDGTVLSRSF